MFKPNLFFVSLLFCAALVFAADIKGMRIAIIWNPNTHNANTPYGWNVGGNDKVMVLQENEEPDPAYEIGLAQLKFVLSAIHPEYIRSDSTLDIEGFYDGASFQHRNDGWFWENPDLLKNVRVYNTDYPVSYSDICSDFGGKKPNVICYVNSGTEFDRDDKTKMFDLFRDASKNDIGLLLIGSRSAMDAKELGEPEIFPVMGVQKKFRFQLADKDIVQEFQFLKSNDTEKWKIADTVLLQGNGGEIGSIYSYSGGRRGDRIWYNGRWELPAESIADGDDTPEILYKYGEWSIKATAVEVIDVDYYPAEMNYGLHYEYNFVLGVSEEDDKVYIINEDGFSPLIINGKIIYGKGTCVSESCLGDKGLKFENGEVKEDWIIEIENPENNNSKDKIVVLQKGFKIGKLPKTVIDGGGAWEDNLWNECFKEITGYSTKDYPYWVYAGNPKANPDSVRIHENSTDSLFDIKSQRIWDVISSNIAPAFSAGGLRELRIELMPDSDIYKKIFKSDYLENLRNQGKTELEFKPWSVGGRISADASLWAFNNQLKNASYDDVRKTGFFDTATYYQNHLATQKAGRAGKNYQQFVIPPDSKDKFGQMKHADELPATSASPLGYYNDFRDKEFNTISVVQKYQRRLGIIGYQPTYLKDKEASRLIIHDLILFIGVNQWVLPEPEVSFDKKPAENNSTDTLSKPISEIEIKISVDTDGMGDEMKECEHDVVWEIWYNGDKIDGGREKLPSNSSGKLDLLVYYVNEGKLAGEASAELLEVKTWTEPAGQGSCSIYEKSGEVKTKVFRSRSFSPLVAGFYDINADGKPDYIIAPFDTLYQDDLPTKAIVKNPFTGADNFIEIGSERFIVDGNAIKINLTKEESERFGVNTGFETNYYLQWYNRNFKDGYAWGIMEDKISPVIKPDGAYYKYGALNSVGASNRDTLFITFTEYFGYNEYVREVFYLYDKSGNSYKVSVEKGILNGNIVKFPIYGIENGYLPSDGDLINVNVDAEVWDGKNKIDNEDNKKEPLKMSSKPVDLKTYLIIIDSKKYNGGSRPGEAVIDEKYGKVWDERYERPQTILFVDPNMGGTIPNKDSVEVISASVIDPVGNVVIETSGINNGEHLRAVLTESNFPYGDGLSKRECLAIVWDGKNTNGRSVGAGSYRLFLITKWPGNQSEFLTRGYLGISK